MRHHDRRIILIDKDPNIVQTWQYLIKVKPSEIAKLPLLSPGVSLDDLDLIPEARTLLGWWVNPGSAVPKRTMGKFRGGMERYLQGPDSRPSVEYTSLESETY